MTMTLTTAKDALESALAAIDASDHPVIVRNIIEALASLMAQEPSYDERLDYERRILAIECLAVRLKRLVRQPDEPGSYVGDTFYPVGGTEASHRWNGDAWEWLPDFDDVTEPPAAQEPSGDVAGEALQVACADIADDYMTSENHHPGYVLIPTAKFEAIKNAVEGQINADAPLRRLVERGLEILPEHYANWRHDAARALQVQPAEPFGYFYRSKDGMIGDFLADEYSKLADRYRAEGYEEIPLYASPPQPEREVEALEAYRAAILWVGADSWDGCSDCIEMLRRARSIDDFNWTPDDHAAALKRLNERCGRNALATTTHTGEEAEGLKEAEYFIRKGGYYYRPNAQGYTSNKAEAGRYTLEEAISYSHPNGPDGPRDEISYELATKDALSTLQPSAGALLEALTKIKSYCEAGGRDTSFISETARTALGGGE
ncbi:hypothetical protein KFK14_11210 [Sphingobium phenoxybenzoativorans]|uniref:Uncharacterized protein n=1 Tax=Sphingobium phenoxybenzoativorans TaxID=1592790 RepID=A0A975KCU8_9SPHN|nr:hypothetical protein [Sphingobium phenoxybenzoativorans]QUT07897.1 hypothetical protein KFK14_11210 [Sphingobium phenoxybenzoativorans]